MHRQLLPSTDYYSILHKGGHSTTRETPSSVIKHPWSGKSEEWAILETQGHEQWHTSLTPPCYEGVTPG